MIRKNARIISEIKDDTLKAAIVGEIDHHGAFALRDELDDAMIAARPKCVELDLSNVDFMDSSGLGVIMGRKSTADRIHSDFKLINPTTRVARIIELAGLGKVVTIEYRETKKETVNEK
ncbi:MAG: STAS domain-containing protein [Clostridia bacterium]|nr:STAS domain-containing protein [Clostridia bacterium]